MTKTRKEFTPEQPNSWESPQARALLKKQIEEDIAAGIYTTFNRAVINKQGYNSVYGSEKSKVEASRSELPIVVSSSTRDPEDPTYVPGVRLYHLQRFDPRVNEYVGDASVYIGDFDEDGNSPNPHQHGEFSDSLFTEDQSRLIVRHANELQAAGLYVDYDDRQVAS